MSHPTSPAWSVVASDREAASDTLIELTCTDLSRVAGGSAFGDRARAAYHDLSAGAQQLYSAAKTGVRDGYRSAVNWGTATVVGAMTAHKVYGSENSLSATVDTIGALKGAFDKTGKLPAWAPFASQY